MMIALTVLSLFVGKYPLSLSKMLNGDEMQLRVFATLRLSRTLIGLAGGFAFGVSGFVYQTVFRNPLASPDIIGVSSGASAGAAAGILFLSGAAAVTAAAFTGAVAAVLLALALAALDRSGKNSTIVLAGIAVHSLAQTALMCLKLTADPERELASIEYWIMGSLNGVSSYGMGCNLALCAACLAVLFLLHRQIVLLSAEEGEARTLGVNVGLLRLIVLLIATLTVALTGGRGSGKTTRINQLCKDMPGIITYAVPQKGVYMESCAAACKVQIGVYDPELPGPVNRMRILNDSFETQAVPMVRKLAENAGEWAFVDEIGYLESGCTAYMDAVRELFDRKRVIAVVRLQDTPFLREMRSRPDAFGVNLDAPFGNTACVIMASGQSKRFGGNKLLADFRGEPMINRILAATDDLFARRVVVTRHSEIAAICKARGIDVVLHDLPYRSDTVRLGLQAVGNAEGCMFCAADQPLLRKDTIASIVLSAANDRSSIWRACFGETPGSPVLFPKWSFEQLMRLPQGKGGGFVAQMHPERVRTVSAQSRFELMDADDRETLELLVNIAPEQ